MQSSESCYSAKKKITCYIPSGASSWDIKNSESNTAYTWIEFRQVWFAEIGK